MKKVLSLLLSICMLCAMLPVGMLTASAAAEVVLFEDDFESYNAGASISAKADTYGEWSQVVSSTVSTVTAAETDASHGLSAYYSHSGTSSGGPRLHKLFYFDNSPTNMTITYDAKAQNCSLGLAIWFADGSHKTLYSVTENDWKSVCIEIDFTKESFVAYVNGNAVKNGTFSAPDYATLEFRFTTSVEPNKCSYLDNVKFTTTDNVDPVKVSDGSIGIRTPEEIMAPFAQLSAAPELAVPAGKYSLFTYDGSLNANNGLGTGSEALWTAAVKTMPAYIQGNPIVRLTNDKRSLQYGSLSKKLAIGNNPGKLTMEYYTVFSDCGAYVGLSAGNKSLISTSTKLINKHTAGVVDGWNKIKAEFDFTNKVCNVYVNDTLAIEDMAFANAVPADTYEVTVGAYGALAPADTMLLDSFAIYQDNAPVVEGVKYYGVTGTNWDLVTEGIVLTEDSYVNNLRLHPRLFINDVQALKAEIANNPRMAKWYATCKSEAEKYFEKPLLVYTYEQGRNASGVLHEVASRLMAWGFVYMMEGDEKYVERGLAEIRNAGLFPDWSNSSPILPSGIMIGFAAFYDWCYHSPLMTDAVKAEVLQIVKDKALWQFVRSYDGVIFVEIANGSTNRTTVANSVGAAMAIAMADEEPKLAQKLIDGAVKSVKQAVEAYSVDGAFAEGTSYWNYANTHMYDFLIELDVAAKEGYVKPAAMQWYYDCPQLINAPDYWAYMSGPTGGFDFGDSSPGFSSTVQMLWFSQNYNKPFYSWFLQRTLQNRKSDIADERRAMMYYDSSYEVYNDGSMPLDKTFNASDLAQVASMRSSWASKNALYAALQGGDNKASHMAKSLGTFVLDANGKRFVKQIGHMDYSALYDPDLYYMERAEGNNTIVANPGLAIDQNPDAIARFIAHGEAENEAFTVLDMTETNDAFADAKRGMFMTKGRNSVVLQDEIKTNIPSEIWWFAHTDAQIELLDGGKSALMDVEGEKMYARIVSGPADAVFTVMDARPLPTSPVAPDEVYVDAKKLAIHLSNVSDVTIAVEFIPLRKGEGIPTAFTPVKPIADWNVSDDTISVKRRAGDALVLLSGSPSVLAMEERYVLDAKNAKVVPFVQESEAYVPVARAARLLYLNAVIENGSVSITRYGQTNTITENVITKDGLVYVPARALAAALGMQYYTDESGLIVLSDRAVNYTAEQKQAVYDELNTCVYVNGRIFEAFTTDKTEYYVPFNETMPEVRVSSGLTVTKAKTQASFSLNGKTYTFHRVDVNDAVSKYNTVLDKMVSSDRPMGTSYIPAYMTDGNNATRAGVKSASAPNATFTFELDTPHYMQSFVLKDYRDDKGSVMENVTYSVRLEDGTWVEAGSVVGLDVAGTRSDNMRTTVTNCTVSQAVTAVRFYMENTDDYLERIYVYEFEAIGVEKTEGMAGTATFTEYVKQDNTYNFTTEILQPPVSGYLVCVLKKGDTQVGMKIVPLSGKGVETYSVTAADCDNIQIMLIESFVRMRILATPEML